MQRRPLLTTIMALGCVVTLAGVTGVFAVFTDRATTGTNTFESQDLGRAADLQIATASVGDGPQGCTTYLDDLATGVMSFTDVAATGGGGSSQYICLRNVGSATVDVTASVIDLLDADSGCTGDESAVDPTCGGDAAGELSGHVTVLHAMVSCLDGAPISQHGPVSFTSMVDTPVPMFELAPGLGRCFLFNLTYQADEAEAIVSQSDTVTWRFAFDGTTAA